jgi:hypothetical protein
MNVIYDSEHYCLLEYPIPHGYELVDKLMLRGAFLQGDAAEQFEQRMQDVVSQENMSVERFEEFLESFEVLMNQRVSYH